MDQEVNLILGDIQESSKQQPPNIKLAIDSALVTIKDSEEISLLQKRYAQLKAQLALVQAHLTERYGGQAEEIKKYLDEAKVWYEKAKENPEQFTAQITEKQRVFEEKIGDTGSLFAQKEKEIKSILQDLWKSLVDILRSQEKSIPSQKINNIEDEQK